MPHPAPLRLLPPAARPIRPASPHPRLARGGSGCRVLLTSEMMDAIGEPRLATASITFDRLTVTAPKIYDTSASGSAVEAGVSYDFDVDAFEDVLLWRGDRKVPGGLKAPLRATILAVYRAARADQALASLSAAVDRVEAGL